MNLRTASAEGASWKFWFSSLKSQKQTNVYSKSAERTVHASYDSVNHTLKINNFDAQSDQKRIPVCGCRREQKKLGIFTSDAFKNTQYGLKNAENVHESQNAAKKKKKKWHIFGAHPDQNEF